jgi:hypothetical protein
VVAGIAVDTAVARSRLKFTRISSLDQDRIVRLILLAEHRRREAALRERHSLEDDSGVTAPPVH